MLILISPAKTLDYETPVTTTTHSQPQFIAKAGELVELLREFGPDDLARLMRISDKLAGLNVARFAQWQSSFDLENSRQALLAFKGDVYTGLDAGSLEQQDLEYAQQHLRILSGLYGVLRPLDLMQPYRLEMGTRLSNPQGANLYDFWGDEITANLNQHIGQQQISTVLNLASNEYFKAVKPKQLQANLVNVDFKDRKNGQYKIISFYAKKARGLMSRFIIRRQIRSVAALQDFDLDGYRFSDADSNANKLVFLRDQPQ